MFLNLNNISPEDLERNVTEVLDKERKAFEKMWSPAQIQNELET